jgi:hypothetical protein
MTFIKGYVALSLVDFGWPWLTMDDNSLLLLTIIDHVDMNVQLLTIANHD